MRHFAVSALSRLITDSTAADRTDTSERDGYLGVGRRGSGSSSGTIGFLGGADEFDAQAPQPLDLPRAAFKRRWMR